MDEAPRLLIVDDDADFAATLVELIAAAGYEVDVAATVEEAKRAAVERKPLGVLLDLGLPDRASGLMLATWLHRTFLGTMVVIVISGYSSEQDKNDALAHGADYVLGKPVDIARLHSIIAPGPVGVVDA